MSDFQDSDRTGHAVPGERDYLVFRQVRGDHPSAPVNWQLVATVSANSSRNAVRLAADSLDGDEPVRLVAVSKRVWRPITVESRNVVTYNLTPEAVPS